ncbi:hypothetical protein AYI69_g6683 [Smittium culicis]|uniref:Uncharacterized protein n=1 Tax=Smittium culicis TaxID=133412 RepID=A0A1R1XX95_9FUNG|nr:hypothetical protein AYI69_g6683 [Smittium culicis]
MTTSEEIDSNDSENLGVESENAQDVKEMRQKLDDETRVALFHSTGHAFLFSGTACISKEKLSKLPKGIQYVVIHNALQTKPDESFLKRKYTAPFDDSDFKKQKQHLNRVQSAGKTINRRSMFETFKPRIDMKFAAVYDLKDVMYMNEKEADKQEAIIDARLDKSINTKPQKAKITEVDVLKECGFSADFIDIMSPGSKNDYSATSEQKINTPDQLLSGNFELLTKLAELQEARFLTGDATTPVSDEEFKCGKQFLSSLVCILL